MSILGGCGSLRFRFIPTAFALAGLLFTASSVRAQPFTASSALPPVPPQGAWGEVIMANARWLVVQNMQGQQFPIAMDAINQFLIRWPTNVNNLTNLSLIEAIGQDLGSNQLQTDHVDVFEGSDQTLVAPTYRSLIGGNRVVTAIDPTFSRLMNPWDIAAQNTLYGWAYPVNPGQGGIPAQLHVVGNVLALNPLVLGIPGNNRAAVLPSPAGPLAMSQVTRGSSSFAQKGDLVFLVPRNVLPKSLVVAQLVLYKKMPLKQFALP